MYSYEDNKKNNKLIKKIYNKLDEVMKYDDYEMIIELDNLMDIYISERGNIIKYINKGLYIKWLNMYNLLLFIVDVRIPMCVENMMLKRKKISGKREIGLYLSFLMDAKMKISQLKPHISKLYIIRKNIENYKKTINKILCLKTQSEIVNMILEY